MSWEVKPLGQLCEVVTKGTTPTTAGHRYQESGINFIKVESIGLDGELLPDMFSYVTEECHREQARSQLKKNDILFSIAGALGRAALVGPEHLPANTNQALAIVRLREDAPLDHRFLLKLLASSIVTDQTAGMSGGAAQQNLSLAQVKDIKVPIPPLPEQQRIVTKLDAAFRALSEAQGHVERNRANARELFESYLNGVFEQAANDVEVHALGDMVDFQGGRQPPKSEFIYEPRTGYVRFLQIRDFKRDDKIAYIPISKKNRTCEEHDIMLGRYGASVGNVLTGRSGAYNVALIKAIPSLKIDRAYFYYYLQSRFFQRPLFSVAARSAQDGFSKEDISGFQLPLPDLSAQRKISTSLATLKMKSDELETTYQQKLLELADLKKGLLGAAFRGELG